MTASPYLYCRVCGAANQTQATQCVACSQPVEARLEDMALSPLLAVCAGSVRRVTHEEIADTVG